MKHSKFILLLLLLPIYRTKIGLSSQGATGNRSLSLKTEIDRRFGKILTRNERRASKHQKSSSKRSRVKLVNPKLGTARRSFKSRRRLMLPSTGYTMNVKSQPFPDGETTAIVLNAPDADKPQRKEASDMKPEPLVYVPQFIYPTKKRQVIVHEEQPIENYYSRLINSPNDLYNKMGANNPHYEQYTHAAAAGGYYDPYSKVKAPEYKDPNAGLSVPDVFII